MDLFKVRPAPNSRRTLNRSMGFPLVWDVSSFLSNSLSWTTHLLYRATETRWDTMKFMHCKRVPVGTFFRFVLTLLGGCPVTPTRHVWAQTFPGTSVALEPYIIPQPGSLFIPPVAVATIVKIGEWDSLHELAIFQHPGLGVFYKPHSGVIVIYDLPATEH